MKNLKLFFGLIIISATIIPFASFGQLKVNSSGQVGIKTMSPFGSLHVVGNSVFSQTTVALSPSFCAPLIRGNDIFSNAGNPDYTWYNSDLTGLFHPDGTTIGVSISGTERFRVNGINTRAIGNFYVAGSTSTPTSAPYLRGTNTYSGASFPDFTWYGNDQTGIFHPGSDIIGFTFAGVERIRILSSGNVGLGVNPITYQLQLATNSAAKPGSSAWSIASDERLKKDMNEFKDGLNVIHKINPITFKYNGKAGMPVDESYVGTIAQDIQKIAPYMVKDWKYENAEGKVETYLALDYGPLDFILINAMKEEDEKVTELQNKILELNQIIAGYQNEFNQINFKLKQYENEINACCNKTEAGSKIAGNTTSEMPASLEQNNPNPFKNNTIVRYYIPASSKKCELNIFSLDGIMIKTYQIKNTGKGETIVAAGTLSAGTYVYNLLIDGKQIDSKWMTLTK